MNVNEITSSDEVIALLAHFLLSQVREMMTVVVLDEMLPMLCLALIGSVMKL